MVSLVVFLGGIWVGWGSFWVQKVLILGWSRDKWLTVKRPTQGWRRMEQFLSLLLSVFRSALHCLSWRLFKNHFILVLQVLSSLPLGCPWSSVLWLLLSSGYRYLVGLFLQASFFFWPSPVGTPGSLLPWRTSSELPHQPTPFWLFCWLTTCWIHCICNFLSAGIGNLTFKACCPFLQIIPTTLPSTLVRYLFSC